MTAGRSEGPGAGRPSAEADRQRQQRRLRERMARVRRTVMVLSGKGGVGKSTAAANLAVLLADEGFQVGLLDADMHGPSVPRLLALEPAGVGSDGESIVPARHGERLRVVSLGLLGPSPDEAIIWRGPLKMNVLRQLLADVEWGELDYLVIDLPPGTGDEPLSLCQLIPEATGAVVVTTPQELALSDVRRCITFCRRLKLPVLGVLENMAGMDCPHCGGRVPVFGEGGGRRVAARMGAPFLGSVPIDPQVVRACDEGAPFVRALPDSPATRAFRDAMEPIAALGRGESKPNGETP